MITLEKTAILSIGGELPFTENLIFSSSNLINHHVSVMHRRSKQYLTAFAKRQTAKDILHYLNQI